jgi:hypothetical protein
LLSLLSKKPFEEKIKKPISFISKMKKDLKQKRSALLIFINSFKEYWKSLHVALPMLIFSIIAIALLIIFVIIAIALKFPLFQELSSIDKNLKQPFSLFFNFYSLSNNFFILFIGGIFFIVGIIIYFLFFSSTLVFAREIVKEKRKATKKPKKNYLELSFKNNRYWLKLIGVEILKTILVIVYFAIIIAIFFAFNLTISKILWISLIVAYLLYVFIRSMPYVLVFYDISLFSSLKASLKNAARCYWSLLSLMFLIDVCAGLASFIFSFIPFVGIFVNLLIHLLFFTPFEALALMHFINERFLIEKVRLRNR